MEPGQHIELRNEFTGKWSGGFEVVDVVQLERDRRPITAYRVKRCSDGSVLPALFPPKRIRPISPS